MAFLRQLLISIVVLAAALAAFVFFVPGATDMLARYGIVLPFGPVAPEASAAAPSAGPPGATAAAPGHGQGGPPGGGPRGGARQMVVVTAPVVLATINDRLTAIGEGAASSSVTIVSPAAGTLAELLVRPGDTVAAGDIIGRLDAASEDIAAERARLALVDAESALARIRELQRASNATTVQVTAAELAVSNAQFQLRDAELALSRRSIVSPIAGTVGLFQVSPGNAVTGQSVVTTIEDTSEIRISFWVPERYAPAVAIGMELTASAVALPGETISGTVSALDNRIDPASRTLEVEAEVPNEAGKLKPGMSFSVTMSFPGEAFPAVDPLSIQWSSAGAYLWKLVDGKVERTPVEIIQRNSDGVLVKAELAAGDQIVTQGVQQLTPGASVRLLDAPREGAPADGTRREGAPL